MPSTPVVRVRTSDERVLALLRDGVAAIRAELGVTPDFPPEVVAAAEEAGRADVAAGRVDRTDLGFVTLDPPTSQDLDQAVHLTRRGRGYELHYAIADVAAFVPAGGPVDTEARRRGQTLYGADSKVPLHPVALSEGAASLLPDQDRPALLWRLLLDADGALESTEVTRALVRSRAKLGYDDTQRRLDAGTAGDRDDVLPLVRELGLLRQAQEAARGGLALPLPEQEVEVDDAGRWALRLRSPLPVEEWNAQLSLATGIGAGGLMVGAGVGLLRTVPPAPPEAVARLRRTAAGLGIAWPEGVRPSDLIRTLDPARPDHAALVLAAARLMRGSGYVVLDPATPLPEEQRVHAGIAAEYAHVTAPLRRLADRFAGEVALAVCAGADVPDWAWRALSDLPTIMQESGRRAAVYERAVVDLVEAVLLADRVGEEFDGAVVAVDPERPTRGTLILRDLGVEAPLRSETALPLGQQVRARLTTADPATRTVRFTPV
ncbi:RNB domain-containing ribonuclease [Nocardioides sp.]|uniref:RNB domain-containing ribonuclease n=1 Tax=Nocardioides sp. TaxID=35761 RepID=UPI003513E6D4